MQVKEKERHCTGSKGRRSKYLQLPISKRDIEKRNDRCHTLMKENWKFKFLNKDKTKQTESKGRKMETISKEVLQINKKHV